MGLSVDALHVKDVQVLSLRYYPERIVPPFYVLAQELVIQAGNEPSSIMRLNLYFKSRNDLVMYLEALKKLDPSSPEIMT